MITLVALVVSIIWLGYSIPGIIFADVYDGIPAEGKIFDETHKCTLIDKEPWYDCSRNLRIVVFESYYVPGYSTIWNDFYFNPDKKALGYAYFKRMPDAIATFDLIVLATETMNKKLGKWDEYYSFTAFRHEINHIQCHCNFHKLLDEKVDGIGENYPSKWSKSLLR